MKSWIINKLLKFKEWDAIKALEDFSYPWLNEISPVTLFKAYYDDKYLFFHFTAFCESPKVYVNTNNKLEVRYSERVELFFRSNEQMTPYYCLEMDPSGRVLDYKADFYRNFNRDWTWPDVLHIKTVIEDKKYTLKGKIALSTLTELGLLASNEIQIGIYRGHCLSLDKKDESIKWISWVDPNTLKPDFHVPSSFGFLVLK